MRQNCKVDTPRICEGETSGSETKRGGGGQGDDDRKIHFVWKTIASESKNNR